jgi:pantoate--beta-alanine ligase
VFNPSREELYPNEPSVTVHPGPLADELEGQFRPGHFTGVLTVVAKLLNLTAPDLALFGEKDYQQLTLVREMVNDLDIGVDIVAVPTVREPDGLALSSRNRYLDPTERVQALALYRALSAGAKAGAFGPDAVLKAARDVLETAVGIEVDYFALRAPDLGPVVGPGEARMLVAARVGDTRLIDNLGVTLR